MKWVKDYHIPSNQVAVSQLFEIITGYKKIADLRQLPFNLNYVILV